jgi:hypothetical protein
MTGIVELFNQKLDLDKQAESLRDQRLHIENELGKAFAAAYNRYHETPLKYTRLHFIPVDLNKISQEQWKEYTYYFGIDENAAREPYVRVDFCSMDDDDYDYCLFPVWRLDDLTKTDVTTMLDRKEQIRAEKENKKDYEEYLRLKKKFEKEEQL